MINFLSSLSKTDLWGKKILVRVDFNVPLLRSGGAAKEQAHIGDGFRIKSHKETIDYLVNNGALVMLVSHVDSINSFAPIVEEIGFYLGQTLTLLPLSELEKAAGLLGSDYPLILPDNIRQDPREIENDKGLAIGLSKGFDFYVNDAFSVSHRNHASVVAVTKELPSYAGFLIEKEITGLSRALDAPATGKTLVLGGAKISTKLPVIKNFLDKAEKILIGGAIANDYFQSNGINIGASLADDSLEPDVRDAQIILPKDFIVGDKDGKERIREQAVGNIGPDEKILDIGRETAEEFSDIISRSSVVIWNGPMGLFENENFAKGTEIVAKAIAAIGQSVVGGGDTIAAADNLGLLDKFSFVSTGGGAMLDFLADNRLPGLEVLGYYE